MLNELFIDRVINRISECSPIVIVIFSSVFVSFLSALFVYIFTSMCGEEHTEQLFKFSVIIPLITTPVIVSFMLLMTKHLKFFKENLEEEIEKNKKKDIMLFEQARFVLMGEMMANISHQWKQPLNTINLAVISAKTSNAAGKDLNRYFNIMEDNVNYLATTIDDFMSFFDKKTHLELRSLENIIKEIRSIIQTHIKNREINLNIEINENTKDIMIASSISQVILNLLNNAKDAFDDNATNKNITLTFSVKNLILKIVCRDNGRGIPVDIQDKLFDPYFTTKSKTQGTGIGLYMSKQIVQKLFNGDIDIDAKRGILKERRRDTCFYIDIPYSDNCIIKEQE